MGLDEYRQRRRFAHTPEPDGNPGDSAVNNQWRFVVQKHDASRLHYDFRLELDGVLKSWAIPKGPCLDPAQKRLAIHVEDHPLEYLDFEGVIPKEEYGGGTVLVWDIGRWIPREDAARDYQAGRLKFDLDGHKLQGGWMLVRLDSRSTGEPNQWLMIKEHDGAARRIADFDVQNQHPESVLSGRDLYQIAQDRDAVWTTDDSARSKSKTQPRQPARRQVGKPSKARRKYSLAASKYPRAKRAKLPPRLRPCLPTVAKQAPTGPEWIHEIKYDGYRLLCRLDREAIQFYSRSGQDWTEKLPSLSRAAARLPCRQALLDGEVVMMADDGTTSFQALQNRIGAGRDGQLRLYLFDLLYLNGYDLRPLPLRDRKQVLSELLDAYGKSDRIIFSEHLIGEGPLVFQQACKLGAEGIVSKRIDRRYAEGRCEHWLKIRCLQSREFLVGGFTPPSSSRKGLGAILLGAHDQEGGLQFAGKVGTGFTHDTLIALREQLDALRIDDSPFVNLHRRNADKGTVWVRPELIAEIEFAGWTNDLMIRFGSFRGIRDDVGSEEVDLSLPASLTSSAQGGRTLPEEAETSSPATPNSPPADLPPELASLQLTHPDRVVYPEKGITKLGVATYYGQVGRWMLPHIAGRPLSLLRCPGGVTEPCFFQKRAPQGLHPSVERIELPGRDGDKIYLVVHDLVGLLALVQFGVLEFHVRGARADRPDRPDRLVFDLDPDVTLPWSHTTRAALELRDWLATAGLVSFVKTTGGKGLHLVVPIRRRHAWDEVKRFCRRVAAAFEARSPGRYTKNPSKAARRGKILLDYMRNTRGATAVAAFSTRARPQASVSVPVAWEELDVITSSDGMNLQSVVRRLQHQRHDPWAELEQVGQGLSKSVWKTLALE